MTWQKAYTLLGLPHTHLFFNVGKLQGNRILTVCLIVLHFSLKVIVWLCIIWSGTRFWWETSNFPFLIFRSKRVLSGKQMAQAHLPQQSLAASYLWSVQQLVSYLPHGAAEGPSNHPGKACPTLPVWPRSPNSLHSSSTVSWSWKRCSQIETLPMPGLSTPLLMQMPWACMTTMTLSSSLWILVP